MKDYKPKDIRNFAVVGHASSGKTMLTEAMLACGGVINRIGSIEAGSTASDYHISEKDHQISVHASLLHTEWLDRKFNIIDTPGYMDFISEGLGAIRVGDFALVVVSASHGVGVGTDQVWEYATHYGIPKMLVINGLDKEHTDFDQSLEACRAHFGKQVFPLTLPIDTGPGFHQILDVPRSEVITFKTDGSGDYTEEPATGELLEKVKDLHRELIEYVAESDDSLLEKFFDQGSLSEEEMREGIHAAVQSQSLIPLFATSAQTNVGVARVMDFIAKYGSSPVDRATVQAHDESGAEVGVELTKTEPVIYVFKTLSEAHVGEMSFFRVYSGTVKPGIDLYNSGRNVNERLGQIFTLNGKNRESVDHVNAGDIGAVVKLRDTHTGNTLCSPKHIIELPKVVYPNPNIHAALRLKAKGDEERIAVGLSTLHEEDPTFHHRVDSELHQTVVSGQGELHLQIIVERLKRRFNVEVELSEPRVPYRETIHGKSEAKYRHKKQSGGAGQFGEVWLRIETAPRDSGVDFKQTLVGTNVDRVFVPSVEKGVKAACTEGILAGYRVTDVKINFYDGKMHPVDSKDIAFQIAGYQAFKEAFLKATPRMLEPICSIMVKVPDSHMGDVMGDISSRRGRILGMDTEGQYQVIKALVPQKELYHYSTTLRSLTGGRGMHSEEFDHYEEVPREFEQKIIATAKAAKEEE
ncbi:MAG: elongation factor G [Verrucomicrobia bacterium]|nr:MAG: elongation factor G [Verrucomicrobiota bacterium]